MSPRFTLFRRGSVFYAQDTTTGRQTSLRTCNAAEARTLLHAKNEAFRQPTLNLQIARAYLSATDPEVGRRTWRAVMDAMARTKHGVTLRRHHCAMRDAAFDAIRALRETNRLTGSSAQRFFLRAFFFCQCWQTVFVILASHERSFAKSSTSAVEKYFVPLGGGLPKGRSNRAATRIGMSCVWQLRTHAVCSTVSRAGGWPSSVRKRSWSSLIRIPEGLRCSCVRHRLDIVGS